MAQVTIKNVNRYPEFQSNVKINGVINFIQTGNIPHGIRNQQRYTQKYGQGSGFAVLNNELIFNVNPNKFLTVARPQDKNQILTNIYNDETKGLGVGLTQFYEQVKNDYLNISKRLSDNFLKGQGDYQIGRLPFKATNRPIRAQSSNQIWAIDLIDMSAYYAPLYNGQSKYIFSCVDLYSGKVWAFPISNRNNNENTTTLRDVFEHICNISNTHPHIIKVDQEFSKGDIKDFFEQHDITIIQSKSHTPTDNSRIERVNREIRKKIRAGFIKHNNLRWVQHLQTYVDNINNQKKSGKNQTPNEIWTPGYNRQNNVVQNGQIIQRSRRRRVGFRVGDLVRLNLKTYEPKLREREKKEMEKYKIVVRWSPNIYRIHKVYITGSTRSYALIRPHIPGFQPDPNGQDLVLMNGENIQRYYENDLQKLPTRDVNQVVHPTGVNTFQRADVINKIN